MCGIGGSLHLSTPVDEAALLRLRDAMTHRGPDGAGITTWERAGLVHRRLSILDLSEHAAQPMRSADGRSGLSFNGEIYNFNELKRGLSPLSSGDSEVLLLLIERDGLAATLPTLNGMFAFAWMEPEKDRVTLVRDRLGQKPLYYAATEEGIVFASELQAFFSAAWADPECVDPDGVDAFWSLGYIPSPGTLYKQIKQVRPGHQLVWEAGKIQETAYWSCAMGEGAQAADLDALADELDALLRDSIRLRLLSDVPVGLFLSGGIDSSLICALAKEVAGPSVQTFTIGFEQGDYDESAYARAVADHLGLPNTLLMAGAPEPERALAGFGQPFGDPSALPTLQVCELARQHVTVVLTGDAGDELFGGYDDYREGLGIWGEAKWNRAAGLGAQLRRIAYRRMGVVDGFDRWATLMSAKHRRRLFRNPEIVCNRASEHRKAFGREVPGGEVLAVMQNMDLHTYLPDDILVKLDRMSMAVSLEARSPLLDHRIVEFAARLPFQAKIDDAGHGKKLLRHLLARYLPPTLTDRPKQGFTPPTRATLDPGTVLPTDPWLDPLAAARYGGNPELDERLLWTFASWNAHKVGRT